MTNDSHSFKPKVDFMRILKILSTQIYDTPFAFIRENVQNAVDAVRIQALRENKEPNDSSYTIDIQVDEEKISVCDNGIGMSKTDLENYYWSIGASGKRTKEAFDAGCVGTFGIGGYANFGVCRELEVISHNSYGKSGILTKLSISDIEEANGSIPDVIVRESHKSSFRGTIVNGYLFNPPNIESLKLYLKDFVKYVPTKILFNGEPISQEELLRIETRENYTLIDSEIQIWKNENISISGRLYEDKGNTIVSVIENLEIDNQQVNVSGVFRFESGEINILKRGFKLCSTQIGCVIGIGGQIDCDRFVPTAGRDSLDAESISLLHKIVTLLEKVVILKILESTKRITENARIFRFILQHGLIDKLDNVKVGMADGTEYTLGNIKNKSCEGVKVFFGLSKKQALNQIMHNRGHLVVLLTGDNNRQNSIRKYLELYCNAKAFDGMIECVEHYDNLNLFEKIFISQLEQDISKSYEIHKCRIIPGRLSEDTPTYIKEHEDNMRNISVYVDVRHPEVTKLQDIGFSQLFYSLISVFCREYLGPSLKKWSPKFFGDGALNLEFFAKRRSELWVLLKGDIGIIRKGGQHQIITRSDVQVLKVDEPNENNLNQSEEDIKPRLLQFVFGKEQATNTEYYIRILDSAFNAYGDLLPECVNRGVVWAGNKILFVASDTDCAVFQYEIRLDEIAVPIIEGEIKSSGAIPIERPFHELYEGLYLPIPTQLEEYFIPKGDEEVRLELHCDWIDMRTAKQWSVEP